MQPGGVATPTQAKCSAHSAPHAPGTGPRAPTALPPASVPNKEKAGAPAAYVPLPVGFLGMTGVVGVSRVRGLGIHSNGRRALGEEQVVPLRRGGAFRQPGLLTPPRAWGSRSRSPTGTNSGGKGRKQRSAFNANLQGRRVRRAAPPGGGGWSPSSGIWEGDR